MTIPTSPSYKIQDMQNALKHFFRYTIAYSKEVLMATKGMQEIAKWYAQEGKLESSSTGLPKSIVNKVIEILVEQLSPYLEKVLIKGIEIEVKGIDRDEVIIEKVNVKVAVDPYIDFIKEVNDNQVAKGRLTFRFLGAGRLEQVKIRRTRERTEISIGKFSVPLSISLIKLGVSGAGMNIEPLQQSITLYENEFFKMESLSFYLPC